MKKTRYWRRSPVKEKKEYYVNLKILYYELICRYIFLKEWQASKRQIHMPGQLDGKLFWMNFKYERILLSC